MAKVHNSTPPGLVTATEAAKLIGISVTQFTARYADDLESWQTAPRQPRYFRKQDVAELALNRRYTRLVEKLDGLPSGGLRSADDEDCFIIECPECGGFAIQQPPRDAAETEKPWPWLCEQGHGSK